MMIPMRTLLSVSLAAALAGCSLAPTYERPDAPVSAAYPAGAAYKPDAVNPAGVATADVGWRDFFTDPLLQRLIEMSLANNRDLRVAALNVARAQYRIQRSNLMPSVGLAGKETAQRTPGSLTPSGEATTSHNYQVGAALSTWELDLFGRIRSLSDKALESYLALDETRTATQLSLVAEVANAYLTLRADQELLALTRDTLKSQQDSFKLTQQSYDIGLSTALDLSQAEVGLRTAERNLSQYTRQAAQDRNALVLLAGQPLPDDLSAALDQAVRLDDGMLPTALPAGLPSDLLARRPDIRAAEHQLKGANANIGAARAAFFPTISLTGTAGTASSSLGGLFDGGSGPGASRRRSRCRSSPAARCWPDWTWPMCRRTCRSRSTKRRSSRAFAKWPTRWPGAARWTSRSRRSACWWTPASAPTMCPTSASARVSTTT